MGSRDTKVLREEISARVRGLQENWSCYFHGAIVEKANGV